MAKEEEDIKRMPSNHMTCHQSIMICHQSIMICHQITGN
jgi:hypothetical protein